MGKITGLYVDDVISSIDQTIHTVDGKEKIFNSVGGSYTVNKEMAIAIAQDLCNIIIQHADKEFTSSQASILKHIQEISIGGMSDAGNGYIYIELSLNGDLSRPSLIPGESAYNIVSLFIKGWSPKKKLRVPVIGRWRDMTVAARTYKAGMGFTNEAISEFNSKYAGTAYAELESAYS